MRTARQFTIGRSQAVRLPKEFRFEGDDVFIKRVGQAVVLLPRKKGWELLESALKSFEPGFTIDRSQPGHQARTTL